MSNYSAKIMSLCIDHERLLRNITVAYATRKDDKMIPEKMEIIGLGVPEKALVVAESLVRSRKDLFTQVYWHHSVRALKAMLGFVARNTLLSLDEDNNSEKREDFWSAFHETVLWLSRISCARETIVTNDFSGDEHSSYDDWLSPVSAEGVTRVSGLSLCDDTLLLFFRRFAPPRERHVIDAIRGRLLFKRLYVLTYSKEKEAYDRIYERFRTYRLEGKLNEIEGLRVGCERLVRGKALGQLDEKLKDRSAEAVAKIRSDIELADPLILVDIPVKAVSPSIEKESIYYVPESIRESESRREDGHQFLSTPVALTQTPFDKEVGKIRVFAPGVLKDVLLLCIPDHHEVITEFLIR
jgi:hypothetical protein